MSKKILIAAALKAELQPFLALTRATLVESGKNNAIYQGKYNDMDVILANFGIGGSFNKNFCQFAIKDYSAAFLVGMAGGLKKYHKIGAPAFPENIISVNSRNLNDVIHPSENFLYKLKSLRPQGTLICSNKMINNKEKIALSANIDFVDMESYSFSRYCLENDLPFLVIKALSDNLTTQFPRLEFIREKISDINLTKAFFYYLGHPIELVWLYQIYRNMKIAVNENYKTVVKIMEDLFAG